MARRPVPTPPTTVAPPSPRPKPRNLRAARVGGTQSVAPPEPPPGSSAFTVAITGNSNGFDATDSMAQSVANFSDSTASGIDRSAMDISDIRSKFESAAVQERGNSVASTSSPRNPYRGSFTTPMHNYTLTAPSGARQTAIAPSFASEASFVTATAKIVLPKSNTNSSQIRTSTYSEETTALAETSKLTTSKELEGTENPFLTSAEGGEAEEASSIEAVAFVQPTLMAHVIQSLSPSVATFAASTPRHTNLLPIKTSRPPTTYLTRSPSPTKTSYVNTISATSIASPQTGNNLTSSLNGILQTDASMKKTARKSYVSPKILGGGIRHSNSSGSLSQLADTLQNENRQLRRNSSDAGLLQNRHGRPLSALFIDHDSAQAVEPELTAEELSRKVQKRKAAIREFVTSEHTYWMDMTAIIDCCYLPAKEMVSNQKFMERDVRTLFSNIPAIADFSGDFVKLLSAAGNVPLTSTSEQESTPSLQNAKSVSSPSIPSESAHSLQNECLPLHVSKINITVAAADHATDETMSNDRIGEAFLQNSSQISMLYAEYCSRHESAVIRLQEMESGHVSDEDAKGGNANAQAQMQWLKGCVARMKGRTNAWDLGSLIIKPVQRVLKYPLLLQAILKETPHTHPDYGHLKEAVTEAQKVADHVNEIKKRKDLVEQITGVKKKDVDIVRGINKKWTRAGQQLKQVTGMGGDVTVDPVYEALVERMEILEQQTRQFARDVASWIRLVKEYIDVQENVARSFEELYILCPRGMSLSDNPKRALEMAEYKKCVGSLMLNCWKELDKKVKEQIHHALDKFLALRAGIDTVIQKRGKKLLDYTRSQSIKARGDTPDKALQESANAYLSIHAQLLEELPKFIGFGIQYLDAVLCRLAKLQGEFYHEGCLSLMLLAEQMGIPTDDTTKGAAVEAYVRRMEDEKVNDFIQSLQITRWTKEQPLSRGTSFMADRHRSTSMMDLGSYVNSQPSSPLREEDQWPPTSETSISPRRRERSSTIDVPVGMLIPSDTDPFADPLTGLESFPTLQPQKSSKESKNPSHFQTPTTSTHKTSSTYNTTNQHEQSFDMFASSKKLLSRTNSRTDSASNGWKPSFPMHSIPIDVPPLFSAVVVRAHFPEEKTHLKLVEGDIVNVREVDNYKRTDLRAGGSGWWFGENIETGAAGYFPKTCCVKME